MFPRAALSEGSWPGLLAGGDFGLQAWRTSEGHGHDEMRDACLEFSVEPLCDFSGLSLSILFSISVLVVLFLFFSEQGIEFSGWFGKRLRTYNFLHNKI